MRKTPRTWPTLPLLCLLAVGCAPGEMGETPPRGLPSPSDAALPEPGDDAGVAPGADAEPGPSGDEDAGAGADAASLPGSDGGEPPPPPPTPTPSGWRVVGYFAAWDVYGRDYHVADLPAAHLTHVNYAFANLSADGECVLGDAYADTDKAYEGDTWEPGVLRGSFHQLALLKERHPHLRTLISVGGWTWSSHFSDAALTADSRARLARSCVEFMRRYGFDGVDIDWEYPVGGGDASTPGRPEDRRNYTLLLEELRRQLDAASAADGRDEPYLLTIAAPAGPTIIDHLEVAQVAAAVDWINVMTYDFHGSWDRQTGMNAPLFGAPDEPGEELVRTGFHVDAAVSTYLERGTPPGKLVMGVPFYGRSWSGVPSAADGRFQAATGAGPGTWEDGVLDWHDIQQNYLPRLGRHFDETMQVPWLYDAAAGVFITYDDPASLARKREYAASRGLGGLMVWEMSSDDADHSLVRTLR